MASPQRHAEPISRARELQVADQIGQALELGWHDCRLGDVLLAYLQRTARAARHESSLAIAAARYLAPDDLPVANQPRCELRCASLLAARAAKNQGVAAVLHDGLCIASTVSAGDLGNGLH